MRVFLTRFIKNEWSLNSNNKNGIMVVEVQQLCDKTIYQINQITTNLRQDKKR